MVPHLMGEALQKDASCNCIIAQFQAIVMPIMHKSYHPTEQM
jgi:hypothetical protein